MFKALVCSTAHNRVSCSSKWTTSWNLCMLCYFHCASDGELHSPCIFPCHFCARVRAQARSQLFSSCFAGYFGRVRRRSGASHSRMSHCPQTLPLGTPWYSIMSSTNIILKSRLNTNVLYIWRGETLHELSPSCYYNSRYDPIKIFFSYSILKYVK